MSLARQLLKLKSSETLGFAVGVITDTSPLTVHINGDNVDIADPPVNAGYSPVLGDNVIVLRPGPGFFVLCKIA